VKPWSNLATVVYKRTYARKDHGRTENWADTVERVIGGNVRGFNLAEREIQRLRYFMRERKATPGGRGLWFSGCPGHDKIGGAALCNCWFFTADRWQNFVTSQDLLMLGGGVGMSVEYQYVSKLPRVRKGVAIVHQPTKDADFIVPDSREGWNELTRRVLEAFFETGRSFSYSTVCVRGQGEAIKGFGGTASGPGPLVIFVEKLCALLRAREGKAMRPIDAADTLCCIAEMVVAGNVRRSALIILGDPWDKAFLKAKRWDLGVIPSQRSNANFSLVAEDVDDLHPLFWDTYQNGEPFGIVNRSNIRKFGRMGELKKDTAVGVNPCAEATLESNEPCNLQEIALPNLTGAGEFFEAARLMHRWGKRVTMERYHHPEIQEVVERNRRVGTSITGCLQAPKLFRPDVLDEAYAAIQDENIRYALELGINPSIRTTLGKPSGTLAKVFDVRGEGVHCALSRCMIQRIRMAADDPMIPELRAKGHYMEPVIKLDGTLDHGTLVVDFYIECPTDLPVEDEGFDTWQQLDTLLLAQKHWADQAVSVTVYYKKSEIPQLKAWLALNLKRLKTISFLCANDHGFKQAPKEAISRERYEELSARVRPIDTSDDLGGMDLQGTECEGGACPIK
jgi:ribonucleoside-triphosphate reductase